jgi:hypothetical protein
VAVYEVYIRREVNRGHQPLQNGDGKLIFLLPLISRRSADRMAVSA